MRRRSGRWLAALSVGFVGALVVAACGGDNRASSSTASTGGTGGTGSTGSAPARVLHVVTTTTQITDFARNIGGDQVKIYAVLKPNVDPHDYEPTPADLDAIAKADVIVKNGVALEKWFGDTIRSASPKGPIVDASQDVPLRSAAKSDEPEGDPHVWHNPQNAKVMAANIAKAFEAVDAGATPTFETNLAAYSAQLDALDANIKAQIATLPNKKLVTNHDAFGYYVDHFGLEFVGSVIPSFDSQAELSPGDINDLVAKIKAQGVKAVFSESSLPPKTAEAIAREAGVKVVDGDDALYGDTLGPVGSDGDTYLKMEEHNTKEIVANLG
ncbi:MAG TPA: metal ABC transporter substrate-binding protein [Acidimicrobiales bacterium]|nr:metal ABC transporter substrate-binding protein [Acidimicrobiales bacterium]